VYPGLEKRAPTVEKQTYVKKGYRPCDPTPCLNGGQCTEKGAYDFACKCPSNLKGVLCEIAPRTDCTDLKKYYADESKESGVYQIDIPGTLRQYDVYCDMETDGGGWTTIHRRTAEHEFEYNFNVSYYTYGVGFGKPGADYNYWMGLNAMQILANSSNKNYTLRVELQDCTPRKVTEEYQNFWLGDDSTKYTLHLKSGSASGTAGDALTVNNKYTGHNNMPFSTPDRDNDNKCASQYNSGWWFNDCFDANLNGVYYPSCTAGSQTDGVVWLPFKNAKYSLARAEMKIRRAGVL